VNVKTWNDLTTVALPLVPTTAGRTLDVSAGGEAGVDWANVGSPTTTLGLSGTTIANAGDPWGTALPGSYAAGSAGFIVGNNLNATVSSVKAKTDNLPSDPADASDVAGAFATVNSTLGVIAGYIDTEITTANSNIANIQTRIPTTLVGGRMDVSVGAMAANVVTASAMAADAIAEIRNGTSSITISRAGETSVTYTEVRS
jgi:hypothetical protein